MKLTPLGDKVVVQVIAAAQQTPSGIYLPDSAQKKPQEGTVIAVGTGRTLDTGERNPVDVTEGDRVLFNKYGGNDVIVEGQEYTILDQDQIFAVLG